MRRRIVPFSLTKKGGAAPVACGRLPRDILEPEKHGTWRDVASVLRKPAERQAAPERRSMRNCGVRAAQGRGAAASARFGVIFTMDSGTIRAHHIEWTSPQLIGLIPQILLAASSVRMQHML